MTAKKNSISVDITQDPALGYLRGAEIDTMLKLQSDGLIKEKIILNEVTEVKQVFINNPAADLGNVTAASIDGANVIGAVATATHANVADTANSIPASGIVGTVANATYAAQAGHVGVANVVGIGNIATINKDGSNSNVLYGNGVFASLPVNNYGNSNVANYLPTYSGDLSPSNVHATTNTLLGDHNTPGAYHIYRDTNQVTLGSTAADMISINSYGISIGGTGGVNIQGAANADITIGDGTTGNVKFPKGIMFNDGSTQTTAAQAFNQSLNTTNEVTFANVKISSNGGLISSYANTEAGLEIYGEAHRATMIGRDTYYDIYGKVVASGTAGNIQISTKNHNMAASTWTFDYDGALFFPDGTIQYTAYTGTSTYGDSNVASLLSAFGSNSITTTGNLYVKNVYANSHGNLKFGDASATGNPGMSSTTTFSIVTNRDTAEKQWIFNNDGSLRFPDGSFQTTAYTGATYGDSNVSTLLSGGTVTGIAVNGGVSADYFLGDLANGQSNVSIPTTDGNVYINTNTHQWNFNTDGSLTVPGVIKGPDTVHTLGIRQSSGCVSIASHASDFSEAAGLTLGFRDGLRISSHSAISGDGNTHYWDFDTYGNLNLPGSLVNWADTSSILSEEDTYVNSLTALRNDFTQLSSESGYPWGLSTDPNDLDYTTWVKLTANLGQGTPSTPVSDFVSSAHSVQTDYNNWQLDLANGSLKVAAGSKEWRFGGDGNIKMPQNSFISVANRTDVDSAYTIFQAEITGWNSAKSYTIDSLWNGGPQDGQRIYNTTILSTTTINTSIDAQTLINFLNAAWNEQSYVQNPTLLITPAISRNMFNIMMDALKAVRDTAIEYENLLNSINLVAGNGRVTVLSDGGLTVQGNIIASGHASPSPVISGFSSVQAAQISAIDVSATSLRATANINLNTVYGNILIGDTTGSAIPGVSSTTSFSIVAGRGTTNRRWQFLDTGNLTAWDGGNIVTSGIANVGNLVTTNDANIGGNVVVWGSNSGNVTFKMVGTGIVSSTDDSNTIIRTQTSSVAPGGQHTYDFIFDTSGSLNFKDGATSSMTINKFGITANTQMVLSAANSVSGNNSSILFDKNGGGIAFRLETDAPLSKTWGFYQGNITFPDGSVQTTAYTGGGSYGNSNVATLLSSFGSNSITTTGNITAGNVNFDTNGMINANGNVYINSNVDGMSPSWSFLENGNLRLPLNNVAIQFGNGDPISSTTATANTLVTRTSTGNIAANNIGNIAAINLDGNVSNVLLGNGTFASAGSLKTQLVADTTFAVTQGSSHSMTSAMYRVVFTGAGSSTSSTVVLPDTNTCYIGQSFVLVSPTQNYNYTIQLYGGISSGKTWTAGMTVVATVVAQRGGSAEVAGNWSYSWQGAYSVTGSGPTVLTNSPIISAPVFTGNVDTSQSGVFLGQTAEKYSNWGYAVNTTTTAVPTAVAAGGVFTIPNTTGLGSGQTVTITGTNSGTGSISGYTSGTTYYIIGNTLPGGVTSITLATSRNSATGVTVTAGTLTGLTMTFGAQVSVNLYGSATNNGSIVNVNGTIGSNFDVSILSQTNTSYAMSVTLIINQGATPYMLGNVYLGSINNFAPGTAQTISWQGGSAPTGTANKKDVITLSWLPSSTTAATVMFGQLVSFG